MPVLLIPFGVLIVFLVLYGIAEASQVITGSSSSTERGGWHGFLGAIEKAAVLLPSLVWGVAGKAISGVASRWAAAHLLPVTRWLFGLASLLVAEAKSRAEFAYTTAVAIERIVTHVIPGEISAARHAASKAARAAEATAVAAEHEAVAVGRRLARFTAREAPIVRRLTHAIDVAIPRDIGRIRAGERALEDDYRALRDRARALEDGALKTFSWLRAHPFSAAMGVFTGVVAVALARLGYGFLRCSSWQKLGRSMKCSDASLIGDLLGLAADVFMFTELCQVVRLLEPVFETVAAPAVAAITEAGRLTCSGPGNQAPALAPLRLYVPAVVDTSLHVA